MPGNTLSFNNMGDGLIGYGYNQGSPTFATGVNGVSDIGSMRQTYQRRLADDEAARQRGFDAQQNQANRSNQLSVAQTQAGAATLPAQLQQDRFRTIFPFLTSQYTDSNERVGGQNAPLPNITVGGVYSPDQIQQQVNAGRAANDRSTAQSQKGTQDKLLGRGFGTNSPLLQAIQTQQQMAGMQANSELERQLRFDTAGANARQQTSSESLRQQQWAQNEDADIRRRQVANQQSNVLLQALASLI